MAISGQSAFARALRLTFNKTSAVLFSCWKGKAAGDQMPWIATGISSAMCRRKIAELDTSRTTPRYCQHSPPGWVEQGMAGDVQRGNGRHGAVSRRGSGRKVNWREGTCLLGVVEEWREGGRRSCSGTAAVQFPFLMRHMGTRRPTRVTSRQRRSLALSSPIASRGNILYISS